MSSRGWLGFTYPGLTPGPVPLPSLCILPSVPAPGKDSAQEDSYDETGEEAQAGIKTAGRNINNLRYADDTTLVAESEEERKSLLMKERKRRVKKLT